MNHRLEIPEDIDPQWASIIESCWHTCDFLKFIFLNFNIFLTALNFQTHPINLWCKKQNIHIMDFHISFNGYLFKDQLHLLLILNIIGHHMLLTYNSVYYYQ
jgi:hypothetical protein